MKMREHYGNLIAAMSGPWLVKFEPDVEKPGWSAWHECLTQEWIRRPRGDVGDVVGDRDGSLALVSGTTDEMSLYDVVATTRCGLTIDSRTGAITTFVIARDLVGHDGTILNRVEVDVCCGSCFPAGEQVGYLARFKAVS